MPSTGTKLTRTTRLAEDQYAVSDKHIPVEGGEILIRFLTPAGKTPSTTHPILVWLHGGGSSARSVAQINSIQSLEFLDCLTVSILFSS